MQKNYTELTVHNLGEEVMYGSHLLLMLTTVYDAHCAYFHQGNQGKVANGLKFGSSTEFIDPLKGLTSNELLEYSN